MPEFMIGIVFAITVVVGLGVMCVRQLLQQDSSCMSILVVAGFLGAILFFDFDACGSAVIAGR